MKVVPNSVAGLGGVSFMRGTATSQGLLNGVAFMNGTALLVPQPFPPSPAWLALRLAWEALAGLS